MKPRTTFQFCFSILFFLPILVVLTGCGEKTILRGVAEELHLADKPAEAAAVPEAVAILCDVSPGSPCTDSILRRIVATNLFRLGDKAGSSVAVWMLGSDLASTHMVAEIDVRSAEGQPKLIEFIETAVTHVMTLARPELAVAPNRSPIVEGIAKICYVRTKERPPLSIIAISDGREMSYFGDFECRSLPQAEAWTRTLASHQVFGDSLKGVSIRFEAFAPSPIPGRDCPITMARTREIEALWHDTLLSLGATEVAFESETPTIQPLPSSSTPTPTITQEVPRGPALRTSFPWV